MYITALVEHVTSRCMTRPLTNTMIHRGWGKVDLVYDGIELPLRKFYHHICQNRTHINFSEPGCLNHCVNRRTSPFLMSGGNFKQIYITSSEGTSRTCDMTLHGTPPHQHNYPPRVGVWGEGRSPSTQLLRATYRFLQQALKSRHLLRSLFRPIKAQRAG